jgi:putative copper resistance protein D
MDLIAARLLLLASVPMLFGLAAFALYALRADERADRALLPLRLLLAACAAIGLVATLFGFVAIAASMTGTPIGDLDRDTLAMLVRETGVGTATAIRATMLLFVCIALSMAGTERAARIALLGGGVATATLAWGGHAMMLEGGAGWAHLTADIVHLLAAGLWIGALLGLLWLLPGWPDRSAARVALARRTLTRFSFVGTFVVAAIALTGIVNGTMILGTPAPGALLASAYGRMLLGKIALFLLVLGLASTNRFLLTPMLATPAGAAQAIGWLRLSIGTEAALAALILAIVSVLGVTEP